MNVGLTKLVFWKVPHARQKEYWFRKILMPSLNSPATQSLKAFIPLMQKFLTFFTITDPVLIF